MNDGTRILSAIENGDSRAAEQLLPLVYDELRKLAAVRLAQEQPGQTLQPTALVHEAYLRLADADQPPNWNGRGHFFAAAAEAMRRILVDNARRKGGRKHGQGWVRVHLDLHELASLERSDDLIALDEALDHLASTDPQTAELVKFRFFAGMSIKEAAEILGISPRKADFRWAYARAWLFDEDRRELHLSPSARRLTLQEQRRKLRDPHSEREDRRLRLSSRRTVAPGGPDSGKCLR